MEQNEKARYKKWFPFTTYDLDELNNRDIVFCFHHAGGSASVYRKWTLKKEKINFVCVELPGKGTRRKERFIENFEELVGPLVESIINVADDRNILFFGHSMGAAMAFYAAAYMAQNYGREPRKIVVAGRQAPNEVNLTEFKSYMDDDALIKELIRYQATPKEILQNQELLSFVLPEVRRDYKLNESFIYRGECINSPLILHSGVNDMHYQTLDIDEAFSSQLPSNFQADIVIAVGVLNNSVNTDKCIYEINSVMKPGGILLIIETVEDVPDILITQSFMMTEPKDQRKATNTMFLNRKQWLEILEENGFCNSEEFPGYGEYLEVLGQKLFYCTKE